MATQTRLDHETRKHQIVGAARDIIASRGIGSLTTRAIAEQVGVTEAALYRHVRSKDEVLLLLAGEIREALFREITKATASDRRALDKLEHLLRLHLSDVESRQGISFVVIAEALQFGEARVRAAMRDLVDDYMALVERLIVEGQEKGEISVKVSASAAATTFFGMVQATVTRWLLDAKGHPLTENVGGLWELFRLSVTPAQARLGPNGIKPR